MPETLADFIRLSGADVLLESTDPDDGNEFIVATTLGGTGVVLVLEDPERGAAFAHLSAHAVGQLRDALSDWLQT